MNCVNIDFIHKVAVITTGIINLFLFVYVFFYNKGVANKNREKDRKYNLLKTLVLDQTMKIFYTFFEDISKKLKPLKEKKIPLLQKKKIKSEIDNLFSKFRIEFIDNFISIDIDLYKTLISYHDSILDEITEPIFDTSINLEKKDKYSETIEIAILQGKGNILKSIFSYNSEN